ncbi:hypothetical protein Tco_0368461 [Tanacetum coccineum]
MPLNLYRVLKLVSLSILISCKFLQLVTPCLCTMHRQLLAIPAADCLTPKILATLVSLAKANSNGQQLSGNTAARPLLTSVAADERKFWGLPMQASRPYQLDLHVVSGVMSSSRVSATNVFEPQGVVSRQQNLEFDAEKNERYQSTLKFTASLLL